MRHFLAAAALAVVAVPGLARTSVAPPVSFAQDVCVSARVSGVVNQFVPQQCVPTPLQTAPLYQQIGFPGTLFLEVWTEYPSRR